jgi:hypothetical protein
MRLGSTGLRFEADEILAEAKAEAEKILPGHGKRSRPCGTRRRRDVRGIATRLQEEASRAAARVPPQAPAEHAEEAVLEPEAAADTEPTEVATTV